MLTGFHTVKTGSKRNVNIFRHFNGKPLKYVFLWKVTNVILLHDSVLIGNEDITQVKLLS